MNFKKRWAEEEVQILRNNSHLTIRQIAKLLPNKTFKAVENKCISLDIPYVRDTKFAYWSDEDREFVRRNFCSMPVSEIMKKLNKSRASVVRIARRFGFTYDLQYNDGTKVKRWTETELNQLSVDLNTGEFTLAELAEKYYGNEFEVKALRMIIHKRLRTNFKRTTYSAYRVAYILQISASTVREYRDKLGQTWGKRARNSNFNTPGASFEDVIEIAKAIRDNPITRSTTSVRRLNDVISGKLFFLPEECYVDDKDEE